MGRILGVLNYKGGTGKTTTVVNLAVGLVLRGARVLCIDLDAQGNLAMCLGTRYRYSLTHLLLGRAQPRVCIAHVRDNLDIIASDESLLQATGDLWRMGDNQRVRRVFVNRMQGIADDYDYIILDFSPSPSLLSENGLLYARELIVPVSTRYMALVGTRQVIQTLKKIGRLPDHRIRLALILPTFFHPTWRNDREVMSILQRYFADKVADPIRASVKLAEAPSHHKSIFEYAPDSYGAIDYGLLVERVMHND
jgi:chromosome partitioning protein